MENPIEYTCDDQNSVTPLTYLTTTSLIYQRGTKPITPIIPYSPPYLQLQLLRSIFVEHSQTIQAPTIQAVTSSLVTLFWEYLGSGPFHDKG